MSASTAELIAALVGRGELVPPELERRKDLDSRRDHLIGVNLIGLLDLKIKRNGRVDTAWGDKTPVGLARTVRRIMEGDTL